MNSETYTELMQIRRQTLPSILHAKEDGKKVVGYYCTYSPIELAIAAGAVVAPLCPSSQGPMLAADNDLPQNLCPIVRGLYDLAVTDRCPYFHSSDFVIAETTCDGKKKAYEFLKRIKPVHIMDLPQIADLPSSHVKWESEVRRLKEAMEKQLNVVITDEALRAAIHLTNEEARARKALFDLNKAVPALISGTDMVALASNAEFAMDKAEVIKLLDKFVSEVKVLAATGYHVGHKKMPRVLLTGCPGFRRQRQGSTAG